MQIKVGHVSDAQGLKGELYIYVSSGDVSWINKLNSIVLKKRNQETEYKILKTRAHKKGFVCAVENVADRTQAEKLVQAEVWVDENLFVSKTGEQPFLSELLGFQVVDQTLGTIGTVTEFSTNGFQDLVVVKTDSHGQVDVPFVKAFVTEMNFEQKILKMNLPEGLLEVNQKSIQDDNLGSTDSEGEEESDEIHSEDGDQGSEE